MPEPIQSAPTTPYVPCGPEAPSAPRSESAITTLPLLEASPSLSDFARSCADKIDGVAIAIAGASRHPVLVSLVSLKAGWELAACVNETQHEASVADAIVECTSRGGTPVGVLEHSLSCQGIKR